MEAYRFVYRAGQGEITEKKSRFIATVQPVTTPEEALAFVAEKKKEYWDARHNCYAYVTGKNQEQMRCSDDGEPSGTAGRPILDVLLREQIHDAVIVVTRYFGGVLLGTGGLVRAYQKAASEGLAAAEILSWQEGASSRGGDRLPGIWQGGISVPGTRRLCGGHGFWTAGNDPGDGPGETDSENREGNRGKNRWKGPSFLG